MERVIRVLREKAWEKVSPFYYLAEEKVMPDWKAAREDKEREEKEAEAEDAALRRKVGWSKSWGMRQMAAYRSYRVSAPELRPSLL